MRVWGETTYGMGQMAHTNKAVDYSLKRKTDS